ncbi:response regulator [Rhizobium sp. CNPSo 4039]|jgi:DNA-binding LytR/AlgR family response regulator|uniref:response regulator n=1 Tax=Rhizobium sp. CNPSo 4039 TaxID=3021409 RepID=UPI000DDCC00F|nr:response regulator [Rhizobium sp. CNPSo 4039]MDK4713537.1 response regulator [Rhizobium sp. CNPSo 4039]
MASSAPPLRIFCLEDNPLIIFQIEAMIEDLGHIFAGSAISFADLVKRQDLRGIDGVLVDIDLADGRTGPDAAIWLSEQGIPSIFVTGQEAIAAEYSQVVLATIGKPVSEIELAEKLELFRGTNPYCRGR